MSRTLLLLLFLLVTTSVLAADESPKPSVSPAAQSGGDNTSDSKEENKDDKEEKDSKSFLARIFPPIAGIAIAAVVICTGLYCWRKKRQQVFVEAVMSDANQPREFNEAI